MKDFLCPGSWVCILSLRSLILGSEFWVQVPWISVHSVVIKKCNNYYKVLQEVITECDIYYKVWQLLQSET